MSVPDAGTTEAGRPEEIKAVPVRRPGRWVAAVVVLAIAASLVRSAITNPRFKWHEVGQFLFDTRTLHGVVATIYLTVLSMLIGIVLGVVLAVMRRSLNPIVSGASWLYIYIFRGTPVYVQIVFWYALSALYPTIDLGIPFGPSFIHLGSNSVITLLGASLLALGLNEAAYMAEIVRAGIISVSEGQTEAASSLGMSRLQIMRLIVLPQAMRVIVPPTGNETISMLKTTSLVSVIGFAELFYEGSNAYAADYQTVQWLIAISIWYLAMTTVLYVGQYFIERRFGRGFSRAERATLWGRTLSLSTGNRPR
ncbi:MAG TPA: amino acid ABC transporter permease [Solirubrobacteraceae bacterium]